MAGKMNVNEIRELGYSYVNAANFMVRVAVQQELNAKAVEAYNRKLAKEAQKLETIADMEAELERLNALLAKKRA